MPNRYERMIGRAQAQHGDKLDTSELAQQFVPYYNSEQRIRVRFSDGETITGRVGVTTGWRPVFILLRRSNSMGSELILRPGDYITGTLSQGKYRNTRAGNQFAHLDSALNIVRANCTDAVAARLHTSDQNTYGFFLTDVVLPDERLLSDVNPTTLSRIEDATWDDLCDLDWNFIVGEDKHGVKEIKL